MWIAAMVRQMAHLSSLGRNDEYTAAIALGAKRDPRGIG
jgi:hypothetical protein